MTSSIEGVRVGDVVWYCANGWGKVKSTTYGEHRNLVLVQFNALSMTFTASGVHEECLDDYPSVFFAPWGGVHRKDPYPPRPRREVEAWRWVVSLPDGTQLTTRDPISEGRMKELLSYFAGVLFYEIIPGTKTMVPA